MSQLSPVSLVAAMGQIEWAMWANEQALASGLSECDAAGHAERGGGRREPRLRPRKWSGDGVVGNRLPEAAGQGSWGTAIPGCGPRDGMGWERGGRAQVLRGQRLQAVGRKVGAEACGWGP